MPGSTPTAVPSNTPISANSRFIGCSATAMPCASATNASIVSSAAARAARPAGSRSTACRTSGRRRGRARRRSARSVTRARRPKAAAVAANSTAVAGMKPPPSPISAISAARPPRMSRMAPGSALSRAGRSPRNAITRLPIASRPSPTAITIGMASGPSAVGLRQRDARGVPHHAPPRSAASSAATARPAGSMPRELIWLMNCSRFPGAAQHEVVRCRPGTVTNAALGTAPDRRCTTSCCIASGAPATTSPAPPT